MRRFQILKSSDVQYEGVVFTDGTCVVNCPPMTYYSSFGELTIPEGSSVVWLDEEPDPHFYATCGVCHTTFQSDKQIDNIFCQVCRELGYTMLGVLHSGPDPGVHLE